MMPGLLLGIVGVLLATVAVITMPNLARAAADQTWPPFVLVAGLLLIGAVAEDDGLFRAAGDRLARVATGGGTLFFGAAVLITVVTALLNLDTSVAFLTPVLIYTARSREEDEAPLLYACLLLSNAGSLFLPGSNLTNLIVFGHGHPAGASFLSAMWAPALATVAATTLILAISQRRLLSVHSGALPFGARPRLGVGTLAIIAATAFVLLLRNPALPVATIGVADAGWQVLRGRNKIRHFAGVLGAPSLLGLLGIAIGLGALGRSWQGPTTLLAHLDTWGTAGLAALASALVNNLPAAALLSAHAPRHPYALLVGLNVGPNLAPSGSLAWLLWLRSARSAGSRPSLLTTSKIGALTVPVAMAAALAVLIAQGHH